ncbi:MAG: hypothetical protein IPL40_06160 [Proteobacteria bacterium]|nr:hypothetical protein [Pseudomonadota bacterium]
MGCAGTARADSGPLEPEWFGPRNGDLELRLGGDFARLFKSGVTDLSVGIDLGLFLTDWLEGGLSGSLSYAGHDRATITLATETGRLAQALTVEGERRLRSGWSGGPGLWLRFLPFAIAGELLPEVLAPFIGLEFGPRFAAGVTPYLVGSASLGLNLYLTDQIALAPEVGYSVIYATDAAAHFGSSALEQVLAVNWGLGLFFTP